jgi:AraC-like DNA-binding protein
MAVGLGRFPPTLLRKVGGKSPQHPPLLTGTLAVRGHPDPAISRAASLLRDPAARTEDVAQRVGLSERQFRRRSHAAIGYGPKTLQRILRFQRFVRLLYASAQPPDLAALAAVTGYVDQPRLTRECVALSGLTPAALARAAAPPNPANRSGTLPPACLPVKDGHRHPAPAASGIGEVPGGVRGGGICRFGSGRSRAERAP